jgi:outer membrane protein
MKSTLTKTVGALIAPLLIGLPSSAAAADLAGRRPPAPPSIVAVDDYQPFQIRLRATAIVPDGEFGIFDKYGTVPAITGIATGLPGGQIFNASARVSNSIIPEIDLSYYFTKNLAVETIAGYTRHSITATGPLAGIPVGATNLLPISLLAQYHFTDFGAFQPYVGVGVTWSVPYSYTPGNSWTPLFSAIGFTGLASVRSLQIGTAVGIAGQIGFDYMITPNLGINFDLKRILAEPTAHAAIYNSLLNQNIYVRVKSNIDPWLASVGITLRFGGGSAPAITKL